jgi:hypothetical protein
MKFVVTLKEPALFGLLNTTVELFETGDYTGKKGLETGGFLWGSIGTSLFDGKKTRHIVVDTVTNEACAYRDKSSFQPNFKTLRLVNQLAVSTFPHITFLGMFHSHPYRERAASKAISKNKPTEAQIPSKRPFYNEKNVAKKRFFELSEGDRTWISRHKDELYEAGYRLEINTTICRRLCAVDTPKFAYRNLNDVAEYKSIRQALHFDVLGFRVWINATAVRRYKGTFALKDQATTEIYLNVPYLMGAQGTYNDGLSKS